MKQLFLQTRLLKLVLTVLMLLFFMNAEATHLRAGEIRVEKIDCSSRSYKITLIIYTNINSAIPVSGTLSFGDGQALTTPIIEVTPRPDLGTGIGTYTFIITHTYQSNGNYSIDYSEANRTGGILNIANSIESNFYIQTVLLVDPQVCNSTPILKIAPVDRACSGIAFFHTPGAFDNEGDSLSYKIAIPLRGRGQQTTYKSPVDISLYPSGYTNEAKTGPPTFTINSTTGIISWDAPGAVGEYAIAFIVEEWRQVDNQWLLLSATTRDMQILVEECANRRPDLVIPSALLCVQVGQTITTSIIGTDPNGDDVKIEAFSGIFELNTNPATFSPNPPLFIPSSSATLTLNWTTNCSHVRDQPYVVTFKITDRPLTGPQLVSFKTLQIKVIPPPPTYKKAALDVVKRSVTLEWNPYLCENATSIRVFRRVGKIEYNVSDCDTGLPQSQGYSLIAEVATKDSNGNLRVSFNDDNRGQGLDPGARFCYRLLAVFPLEGGAVSKVSIDTCMAPILATAPVITHVSVKKTDTQNGEVIVSWQNPFDLDRAKYPEPYRYIVLRANGFAGKEGLVQIRSNVLSDTTLTDTSINTNDKVFNYRIVLLATTPDNPVAQPIDTSSIASTVQLSTRSLPNKIQISWQANTPWSNQTEQYPYHLIYRGEEGARENELALIDSVKVTESENGFVYVDDGKYKNTPLLEYKSYCYRVKTRGSYDNPRIKAPQENFSQIKCSTPLDTNPPCQPNLTIAAVDCIDFNLKTACNQLTFENKISWDRPTERLCQEDTFRYDIYASNSPDEEVTLLANTTETQFVEKNLKSLKRCYQIRAVDRSGNKSEASPLVCNDNCPYFDLPNVFTPNGDGVNDIFQVRCARFVKYFSVDIINRWGQKVYSYQNSDPTNNWLWNGTDNNGNSLESMIFYYHIKVAFETSNAGNQNKDFRGWVHLVR